MSGILKQFELRLISSAFHPRFVCGRFILHMYNPQETWLDMVPGVRRRPRAAGARGLQLFVEFQTGAHVPAPRHPHEPLSPVLRGRIRFDLAADGDAHPARAVELSAGDTLLIPGDVPHAATALDDGALLIETFSPPREDLLAKDVAASVHVPPATPSAD